MMGNSLQMSWHRKRQIITLLFAGGIVLLTGMAGFSVHLDRQAVKQNAALSEIRLKEGAATRLLVALIDIETGVRGYLIAGDPTYLEPFYRGNETLNQIRSEFGPAIDGWSANGHADETLDALMAARRKLMDDAIQTARTEGVGVAQVRLSASNAKAVMDRMRAVIADRLAEFSRAADGLQQNADSLANLHSVLLVAALTLAILFSIAQFMLFRNEIIGRGAMELALRRRSEERRKITKLSAALQLSDSRPEAYAIIESYATRILGDVSGAFYVYTASRDQLSLVAQWRHDGEGHQFVDRLHASECWGLRQGGRHTGCAATGPVQAFGDAAPLNCRHIEADIGPYTCIPIIGRGQILAMLHLRGEAFRTARTSEALNGVIDRLVDQLSLSLTNLDLREKLENMALRDGLTGLYNRRFLDEVLEHDFAKLKRAGKRAAILLLDVDHFKRFNDTYGHQCGDEALRRVGATLAAAVRASDVVCRYGGEEFLIFLPECDLAEATVKAEAIRLAVAATPLQIAGKSMPPVTVSIGVAIFPDAADNRLELIHLADRALYRAKGAGRNRVECASPAGGTLREDVMQAAK
jgi:diguanylate cyclase (GGDEF)-like protein